MIAARVTILLRAVLAAAFIAAPGWVALAAPTIVIEAESGLVLYAEEPDRPWHPASLTKLMTAYIVFEDIRDGKLSLEDKLQCSPHAYIQPPSKIGLPVGGEIKVDLGLRALIVKSANDVAVMLAERVSGSEAAFIERMNETAKRLGMTGTRFYNANGLPHYQQVTTARDMAILGRALFKEFPQYAEIYAMAEVRVGARNLRSHNELLRTFEGADGMKTGFICASGYNVVASATRGGRRIIAVVLGATSSGGRRERAAALIDYGFEYAGWKSLFSTSIDAMAVEESEWKGPVDLRPVVCSGRRIGPHRKRGPKPKDKQEAAAPKAAAPKPAGN